MISFSDCLELLSIQNIFAHKRFYCNCLYGDALKFINFKCVEEKYLEVLFRTALLQPLAVLSFLVKLLKTGLPLLKFCRWVCACLRRFLGSTWAPPWVAWLCLPRDSPFSLSSLLWVQWWLNYFTQIITRTFYSFLITKRDV